MLTVDISRRRMITGAFSLLPFLRTLTAQDTQPTFSTSVKVVNVLATVRDKQGHVVNSLTKDDFVLLEDGRPQTIQYFSKQTALPLTLGLLVDTSGSERRMIGTESAASHTFIRQVLRPEKDKVFLIHFDREIELLQDLTSSRGEFEKALDRLGTSEAKQSDPSLQGQSGGGSGRGRHGRGGGGGTALYDAIYLACGDVLKDQSGRKALILLTDGDDRGSRIPLDETIKTAQRSDTLVYSIRIVDEGQQRQPMGGFGGPGMGRRGGMGGGPYGRGPIGTLGESDGKKVLQQISRETGGSYFEVSKKHTVDDIYSQIEEELRNQYSLGYTPTSSENGLFHRLEATVKTGKNLTVQTRNGYYSKT